MEEFEDLQTARSNLVLLGRGNEDDTNTPAHKAIHRLTALIESKEEAIVKVSSRNKAGPWRTQV